MADVPSTDDNAAAGADQPRPRAVDEPRRVVLEAVHNMRDLGGLRTADGRTVRKGVLFRSDMLKRATEADLARIGELGLRTVIDLRTAAEVESLGRYDADGVDYRHLELRHVRWDLFPHREEPMPFLAQRYVAMLETGAEAIRDSLDLIATQSPTLVHCIAGKDRTGLVIALALALVGVPDEDIADDFALTAHGQRRFREWAVANASEVFVGLPTPEQAMLDTLAGLRERFESPETYARIIGFEDVDKLKDTLLEP